MTTSRSYNKIRAVIVPVDENYQLLVHGQWFSPGTPTSSTTDWSP
jgi:hypothetical protein